MKARRSLLRRIDTKFVLNSQGSTYNKQVWLLLLSLLQEKKLFSINSTGRKEDCVEEIHNNSGSPCGYVLGYVDGYHFSQKANILIHHGGFGTMSQWIMGVINRMSEEKRELERRLSNSDLENVQEFLSSCIGIARSIAICNMFEQENNARALNEVAGNKVCTVTIADHILRTRDPSATLSALIESAISDDLTEEEIDFWIKTTKTVSVVDAPLHSALFLEKIMLDRDEKP